MDFLKISCDDYAFKEHFVVNILPKVSDQHSSHIYITPASLPSPPKEVEKQIRASIDRQVYMIVVPFPLQMSMNQVTVGNERGKEN